MKTLNTKKAFTMAEAILVMTILGIIATIMITTLKPSQFKDKGLKILYKKILAELDTATTQILIKNSATGKMNSLFLDNESTTFTFNSDLTKTTKLYKKYLASTRKQYDTTKNLGTFSKIVQQSSTSATLSPPFYLKDGALIFLGAGEKYQLDPSQNATINAENCEMPQSLLGMIVIDINGEDEPNAMYKDQFLFPIGKDGIEYESMCQTIELANATPTPDPTPTPTPTPDPEPEPEEPENPMQHIDDYAKYQDQLNQLALDEFKKNNGFDSSQSGESYLNSCYEGYIVPREIIFDKDGNTLHNSFCYIFDTRCEDNECDSVNIYAHAVNGELKLITANEFRQLQNGGRTLTDEEYAYLAGW